MPAFPDVEKLGWIGAVGHDFGDLIDIQAGVALAVLALSVGVIHGGCEIVNLLTLFWVGRWRQSKANLQQIHLASLIRWQRHAVELLGLFGQANGFVTRALCGCRGKSL